MSEAAVGRAGTQAARPLCPCARHGGWTWDSFRVPARRLPAAFGREAGAPYELASAKSEGQHGAMQRQIEATDAEIGRLVYELYGLTKDEIAIVEGAKL